MNELIHTAATDRAKSCHLDLLIEDPLLVTELLSYAEGDERNEYALTALRIGVLALKQAQSRLDADIVRAEGDHLLKNLEIRLTEHQKSVNDQVATVLRQYFDPKSGRFSERVEQLVKDGGDLE